MEINPKNPESYIRLSKIFKDLGNSKKAKIYHDKALKMFTDFVDENGKNPENWYDLSWYSALLGLKKEMLTHLQKAIENNLQHISQAKENPDFDFKDFSDS